MVRVRQADPAADLRDREGGAQQQLAGLAQLALDHVVLGRHPEVPAEELQHMGTAPPDHRGHLVDAGPEMEAAVHVRNESLQLLGERFHRVRGPPRLAQKLAHQQQAEGAGLEDALLLAPALLVAGVVLAAIASGFAIRRYLKI